MNKSKKVWFLIALLIALVLIILFLIRGCKSEGSQVIATNQTEIQAVPVVTEEKIEEPQKPISIEEAIPPVIPEKPQVTVTFEVKKMPTIVEEVAEEPVKEEFTVKSKRYSYQNYIMTVTDYGTYTTVSYPSVVLESDVLDFFGFELERYPYLSDYCFYEFKNGSVVFTYPEYITGIDYADTLAEEILIYLQSLPEEPIIIEEVKQEPVQETLEEKLPVSEPEPIIQQPVTEPAYTEEQELQEPGSSNKFDISVIYSPYSYQRINYTDNDPKFRNTLFGTEIGIEALYRINNALSAGTKISYQYNIFKGFHDYHDLKVNARLKMLLFTAGSENNLRFYYSIGAGSDFVFRDDRDFGCYPLIVSGLNIEYGSDKKLSFMTGIDLSLTWQKGSDVLHLTPFIGCTYHYDLGDRR